MDLRTFFSILLRNWWLIILSVITTAGSAYYVVRGQQPIYRAGTTVELRCNTALEPAQCVSALGLLDRRTVINTTARKATGSAMQEQVAKTLGIPVTYIADADLSAIVVPEANLIEIRALSTDANLAAAITNKVAEELSTQIPEKVLQLDVIDAAVPPTSPIEPQPFRTITLGVVFGLALGVVFALLGYMIQSLRGTPAAEEDLGTTLPLAGDSAQTRQLFTR